LSARLFDHRWFWLLITPTMLYGLIPWKTNNGILLNVQRSSLVLGFIAADMILLVAWLKYRERLFQEPGLKQGHRWALLVLVIPVATFIVVPSMLELEFFGRMYKTNPVLGFSLQALVVLVCGYLLWQFAYSRRENGIETQELAGETPGRNR
jgi:heme/copper-type cytochrome/quinol oxidase subunit 2